MQPHYPTFDNKFMKTKKIILAFDSFKGSASAKALSDAAESAILDILPGCNVIKIPIADGGEGTVDAICRHAKVSHIECNTHDPLMRDIKANYAIIDKQICWYGDFSILGQSTKSITENRSILRISDTDLAECLISESISLT